MGNLKIVLHVNHANDWSTMLAYLIAVGGDDQFGEVRVVVDGDAVHVFRGPSTIAKDIAAAAASGVQFLVCASSLAGERFGREAIPQYVTVVPSGVVALAEAQDEGFAYVKA